MTQNIITRFAPSPTGMLHIGGVRTALFNYLFAKANGGKFLLRIEDTDKERSTDGATEVIFEGMKWLGLDYDDEVVFQSKRKARHQEMVQALLDNGAAYYCYASKEELAELREQAALRQQRFKYDRRWRNRAAGDAQSGVEPVVRIKAPLEGVTTFTDVIQGGITIPNDDLDDFIIQRSDGSPTYMFAVVVDDYDMSISHVIRGDDHLSNVAKQIIIYNALGFAIPEFVHIPLIYGEDGKKLSKRHGATSVTEFRDGNYLPQAMRNYLLRLGFSHGDDEIISDQQAIKWFDLKHVGKSPARFDYKKLDSLNSHYFHQIIDSELLEELSVKLRRNYTEKEQRRLVALMPELKIRCSNIDELAVSVGFLFEDFDVKAVLSDNAAKIMDDNKMMIEPVINFVKNVKSFTHDTLYEDAKEFAASSDFKMKHVAAIVRSAMTGLHISPSIFEIMEVLGRDEVVSRLKKFI